MGPIGPIDAVLAHRGPASAQQESALSQDQWFAKTMQAQQGVDVLLDREARDHQTDSHEVELVECGDLATGHDIDSHS
jgi:Tfp pilus assembly ATPase PilU